MRHRRSSSHRKLRNPKPLPPVSQRANHAPLTLHPTAQGIELPFVQGESGRKAARGGVQLRWAYATAKSSRKAESAATARSLPSKYSSDGEEMSHIPKQSRGAALLGSRRTRGHPFPGAAPSPQHPQTLDRWATSIMHGDACPPHGEMQGGSWYQVRASWQTERGARREEAGMWTPVATAQRLSQK